MGSMVEDQMNHKPLAWRAHSDSDRDAHKIVQVNGSVASVERPAVVLPIADNINESAKEVLISDDSSVKIGLEARDGPIDEAANDRDPDDADADADADFEEELQNAID